MGVLCILVVWVNLALSKTLFAAIVSLALHHINKLRKDSSPSHVRVFDFRPNAAESEEDKVKLIEETYPKWLKHLEFAQSALIDGMSFVAMCFAFG